MHKVLVAIDGSEPSLRAVDYVVRLYREIGPVELVVANVQEPPIVYGEVQVYMSREQAERYRAEASERVLAEAAAKLGAAGVRFTSHALEGQPGPAIAQYAEQSGCDGIVMGSRGMGALGNMVMGSVATKVVHLTGLPVTLVK